MSINLGGQSFSEDQVIAAIAASNDPACTTSTMTLEELSGAYQALLLRVATLEQEHPHRHAGFNVVRTATDTVTQYRMQTMDPVGRTIYITFEVPNDAGGSAAY